MLQYDVMFCKRKQKSHASKHTTFELFFDLMGGKGSKTKKGATADAKFKTEMKLVVLVGI